VLDWYYRYLKALEELPVPEVTLGGEELLVLAPIRTAVEPPFSFQWVHSLLFYYNSLGEPQRAEPSFYELIVKCGGEEWRKDVPASLARNRYSIYLGKESRIISVHSTEPEFHFERLPIGQPGYKCACSWEVKAFSAQRELLDSSGEISFYLSSRMDMLSDLDLLLLGFLFEKGGRFDDAARAYQQIGDERQRNLFLLGMLEKRLERVEEEIKQLEFRGGDEEGLNRLKKERKHLHSMVNIYRAKVRKFLKR
jgi:hypothetical protein